MSILLFISFITWSFGSLVVLYLLCIVTAISVMLSSSWKINLPILICLLLPIVNTYFIDTESINKWVGLGKSPDSSTYIITQNMMIWIEIFVFSWSVITLFSIFTTYKLFKTK